MILDFWRLETRFGAQLIWNSFIPPSKAFLLWRMFHHKMPTDHNLLKRGCHIVFVEVNMKLLKIYFLNVALGFARRCPQFSHKQVWILL